MRGLIHEGLSEARELPVGKTRVDAGGFLNITPAVSTAGAYAEIYSHFLPGWTAFGRGSIGVTTSPANRSDFEAIGLVGISGYF